MPTGEDRLSSQSECEVESSVDPVWSGMDGRAAETKHAVIDSRTDLTGKFDL